MAYFTIYFYIFAVLQCKVIQGSFLSKAFVIDHLFQKQSDSDEVTGEPFHLESPFCATVQSFIARHCEGDRTYGSGAYNG